MHSILLLQHSAPYGTSRGQEMLNMILAASQFCKAFTVLFCEDGVYQLLKHQQPEALQLKPYHKTYSAFPLYDIAQCYVDQAALQERNLTGQDLIPIATLLSSTQIRHLLETHSVILRG